METGPENMEQIAKSVEGKTAEQISAQPPKLSRRTALAGGVAVATATALGVGKPEAADAQGVQPTPTKSAADIAEVNRIKAEATAMAPKPAVPVTRPATVSEPDRPKRQEDKKESGWAGVLKWGAGIGIPGAALIFFRKSLGRFIGNMRGGGAPVDAEFRPVPQHRPALPNTTPALPDSTRGTGGGTGGAGSTT